MFSDVFECIGTIPLENGLVEYFILHFIEMCTLKTLVQFAIFHLAPATAGAWAISEGLHSDGANLKLMPHEELPPCPVLC